MRHTRGFGVGISNYAYWTLFMMLGLALSQIYTRVVHLRYFVASDNAWVGEFWPFAFFSLSRVFTRLEMRHTRDFGVGISNYAYLTS